MGNNRALRKRVLMFGLGVRQLPEWKAPATKRRACLRTGQTCKRHNPRRGGSRRP